MVGPIGEKMGDVSLGDFSRDKEDAKFFISLLDSIDSHIYMYAQESIVKDSKNLDASIIMLARTANRDLAQITDFFTNNQRLAKFMGHDLEGSDTAVVGVMSLLTTVTNREEQMSNLSLFIEGWPRYYIAAKDVLMRTLSLEELSDHKEKMDFGALGEVIAFFRRREIKELKKKSEFKGVEDGSVEFPSADALAKLNELDVVGNNAVVLNLLLNILRNGLKKSHERTGVPTKVDFEIKKEGQELVFRVVDNGKGISEQYLDPDPKNDNFILKEGVSNDKSTGLGLAGAHERIKALGGELRIYSYRDDARHTCGYSSSGESMYSEEEAEKLLGDLNDVRAATTKNRARTVFEIRLPIEKKFK